MLWMLWIREVVFIVAPSHCGGGESCTLRILRMLFRYSRERREEKEAG